MSTEAAEQLKEKRVPVSKNWVCYGTAKMQSVWQQEGDRLAQRASDLDLGLHADARLPSIQR
jgi:hypothetical protein